MPRILVTNDDGIDSEGIRQLAVALKPLGDVVIVAPDTEYSGASAALGSLRDLRPEAHLVHIEGIDEAWSVNGPPAQTVLFARLGAFDGVAGAGSKDHAAAGVARTPEAARFDLVVAGINPGANVGRAVYHSGTVGAAITARNYGIDAIAVSQAVSGASIEGQGWDEMLKGQRWQTAATVAAAVAERILTEQKTGTPTTGPGKSGATAVNINVPNRPLSELKGWQYSTLAKVPERAVEQVTLEPKEGHPGGYSIKLGWGEPIPPEADTDVAALNAGKVAITLLGPVSERDGGTRPEVRAALDKLLG